MIITRSEARGLGLKRFFSGDACPSGHVAERLVSNGTCVTCSKLRLKDWSGRKTKQERKNLERKLGRRVITRCEAKDLSINRYFTGKACANGHIDERRTSDAKCMSCVRIKNRIRRENNPGYFNDCVNRHLKKFPERAKARSQNRRSAIGKIRSDQILAALNKQNYECVYCHKKIHGNYHVDHIIPIKNNGWNLICNIQCTCAFCNLSKGSKSDHEFKEYLKNV